MGSQSDRVSSGEMNQLYYKHILFPRWNEKKRSEDSDQPTKLRKLSTCATTHPEKPADVNHAVLSAYYPRVLTLRDFFLSRLPRTSKIRRRLISSLGVPSHSKERSFIDTTLVGVLQTPRPAVAEARKRDFVAFTQTQQKLTLGSHGGSSGFSISEVVDFAVWLLFHKSPGLSGNPQNILCHGFRKGTLLNEIDKVLEDAPAIPGIVLQRPNENFDALKKPPWADLMPLLGDCGENIMQTLLLDCGIFIALEKGADNIYQLSGIPISDLSPIDMAAEKKSVSSPSAGGNAVLKTKILHKPAELTFMRSRMLYGKPSLNAKGNVRFGMKHIHVLNRRSNPECTENTVHIMKYVFPRQFDLHNVFTCEVDKKETSQPFKDYTLREIEIEERNQARSGKSQHPATKIPKRLRGRVLRLVKNLQTRHNACSYTQLLRYYCPSVPAAASQFEDLPMQQSYHLSGSSRSLATQRSIKSPIPSLGRSSMHEVPNEPCSSIMQYATPVASVTAFCRAIIRRLLPKDTFGVGADGHANMRVLLQSITQFIGKRRFESLTLHQVGQNIKIHCIDWLRPSSTHLGAHMSQSDKAKRTEVFNEFLYYIFDSILIPLIRTNFYVTESGVHNKRLFYFRHDVWRRISESALATLKSNMFESLPPQQSRKLLQARALGYGQVRLLPKSNGTRTIMNFKRQALRTYSGGKSFSMSVNMQLAGIFSVLKYERVQQPLKLGSALFSIGEMHDRLSAYQRSLPGLKPGQLYFVKVDIRSCFDTIPQDELIAMVKDLVSEEQYRIARHCELKPGHDRCVGGEGKPSRKFVQRAVPFTEFAAISERTATNLAPGKKLVVYTNTGREQVWQTKALLKLLQEHVRNNIVKLGKRHFRQKNGIPQGSVLSSLLCSFFYGQFEREHLSFLDSESSLLLRLIDDFLLITTDENIARRFLEVMAEGMPSYGISVNTSKSLTNFEVSVRGSKIPRLHGTTCFPYCGMAIDVNTLGVSKDRDKKDLHISNTLTVESCRTPGQTFRRRVQTFLKIQMHPVLLDIRHNTAFQVMLSLFGNFTETAIKLHQYSSSLVPSKRPSQRLIIEVVEDAMSLAFNLTRSKAKVDSQATGTVSRSQVCWLGSAAFEQVFRKKQSRYKHTLTWLSTLKRSCETASELDASTRDRIVESGKAFNGYKF